MRIVLAVLLLATTAAAPAWDTYADTWVGTDGLGRPLPTFADVGGPRPGRTVGIFYFPHTSETLKVSAIPDILARDPTAMAKPDSPLWGPAGTSHWWGQPLMGYYSVRDPYVLRRHAQWLADAGVDMVLFDTSNAGLPRLGPRPGRHVHGHAGRRHGHAPIRLPLPGQGRRGAGGGGAKKPTAIHTRTAGTPRSGSGGTASRW